VEAEGDAVSAARPPVITPFLRGHCNRAPSTTPIHRSVVCRYHAPDTISRVIVESRQLLENRNMKAQTRLILAVALSSALFASGCKRDNDSDEAATAAAPATVSAPAESTLPPPAATTAAPAPASTAAAPAASTTPVDSGLAFAAMDKNGDGGISKDELSDTEMLYQHFSAADTDGNGKLSSAEVDAHRAEMAAKPGG